MALDKEIKDLAAIKLVLEDTVRVLGVKINNFELSEVYINSGKILYILFYTYFFARDIMISTQTSIVVQLLYRADKLSYSFYT